jgi:hypothetical protein
MLKLGWNTGPFVLRNEKITTGQSTERIPRCGTGRKRPLRLTFLNKFDDSYCILQLRHTDTQPNPETLNGQRFAEPRLSEYPAALGASRAHCGRGS